MRNCAFLLSTLMIPSVSSACLNDIDSDTLANQAQQLPDVVRVITGRFERNPPLYYQMRVARVEKQLETDPTRLSLYDDIAVALDRLERDDEAIAWMKKKRAQLDKSKDSPIPKTEFKEQLYRYRANQGTFLAHRWLRNGANRNQLGDMKEASNLIEAAIEIKPDAHFGREKYQLMAMNWILAPHGKDLEKSGYHLYYSFASYMWGGFQGGDGYTSNDGADQTNYQTHDKRKVKGLTGLIVLGGAWESVDIFDALAQALSSYETRPIDGQEFSVMNAVTLQCLAKLRIEELIESGHRPLFATTATHQELLTQWSGCGGLYPENQKIIRASYRRLRNEAKQWQQRRANYMLTRLKAGRHPDTDPEFWSQWKETAPPKLETEAHWQTYADEKAVDDQRVAIRRKAQAAQRWTLAIGGVFALLIFLFGLWLGRRTRVKKHGSQG